MDAARTIREQQCTRLGPWRVTSELCNHPRMYFAEHTSLDCSAILKVLPAGASWRKRLQFLLEASVAAGHTGRIVRTLDVFEYGGCLVAVVERPYGRLLSWSRAPLATAYAVDVCIAIAEALASMHERGVINGAIRTNAIIVTGQRDETSARLLDLGFCLSVGQVPTAAVLNAAHSMPPEDQRGQGVSTRTDTYGLGLLCFELLTGHPWSMSPTDFLPDATPPRLAHLVRRCLSLTPAHRPASMLEIANELEWIRVDLRDRREAHAPAPVATSSARVDRQDPSPQWEWFVEDGASLSEVQQASLDPYVPDSRARWSTMLAIAVLTAVATAAMFALIATGLGTVGL